VRLLHRFSVKACSLAGSSMPATALECETQGAFTKSAGKACDSNCGNTVRRGGSASGNPSGE
jgi:hypothetical protein